MADVDVVVIGAGVVGLAVAATLAVAGREVVVLDGEESFGFGTSSRNSEVIHAGIYYATTPLKQRLCVLGRERLYRFCRDHHVPHRNIGKLVFAASPGQRADLDRIEAHAQAAGVQDLQRLDSAQARAIEPELSCVEALLSPSTGIVDSHAYMLALLGLAETHGASFVPRTRVAALTRDGDDWEVRLEGDEATPALRARVVVNAAGLHAHALAARTEGLTGDHVPEVWFCRGNYFAYNGHLPFEHLIYPVPVPGGLGTHLTFDLGGNGRFGPDVEWIEEIDYRVDPARADAFATAARHIWPDLDAGRLAPAYSGIRAKLSGPGQPAADFRIDGPEVHGLSGLVNLFGIESPGLTSSLAIADEVESRLAGSATQS